MNVEGVHHLGIIVRDARAAAERFRALGLEVTGWEDYGPGLLRIGFIPLAGAMLELIEPLTAEGFNAEWLQTRGEGLQHIALHVADIRSAMEALRARGVALQDAAPRPGAGDTLIAFLAERAGGALIELTQVRAAAPGNDA